MSISGKELFGKGVEGNLNLKSLKKAGKKERLRIVEDNLEYLIEWYFTKAYKEEDWLDTMYNLMSHEKEFIEPLMKLAKEGNVPKGICVLFSDAASVIRRMYFKKIDKATAAQKQNQSTDYLGTTIDTLKEECAEKVEILRSIAAKLTKKEAKQFHKMGFESPYAEMLAENMVPKKYLTEHNVGRYFIKLNRALVDIAGEGIKQTGEDNSYQNEIGIDLMEDEALISIYEKFFAKVDREVFLAGMNRILLDRRSKLLNTFNRPQKEMYSSINRVIAGILEGNLVVNYTGEKLKKKEIGKIALSKKETNKILKAYSKERTKDMKRGNDSPRRLEISSLADDVYPRLKKAFGKNLQDSLIDEPIDPDQRQQQQNQNNNGNNNQQRNNQNGNGNNNSKNNKNANRNDKRK